MAKAVRDEVLTTAETCRYLKVAPRTLYRYIQEKRVPAFKLGKDWRFVKSELDMWLRGESREYSPRKARRGGDSCSQGDTSASLTGRGAFFSPRPSVIFCAPTGKPRETASSS